MFVEVAPNLLRTPVGDGIHLHQSEFLVPLDFAGVPPKRGLVAANTRDPRSQFTQLAAERLNLPQVAALVRIAGPKCRTVNPLLLLWRMQRKNSLNFDFIFLLDSVH